MNILRRINNSSLSPTWRFTYLLIFIYAPFCLLSIACGLFINTPLYKLKVEPVIFSLPRPSGELFSANALWLAILLWLGSVLFNWIRVRQSSSLASVLLYALPSLPLLATIFAAIQSGQWWLYGLSCIFISVQLILIWRRTTPYYKPALKQFQNKDFDQALTLINQSAQARPQDWRVYLLRASIQYELGNLSAAQSDCEQAIQLKPNEAVCHASLGAILLAQSLYEQAKIAYLKANKLNPKIPLNRLTLGRICYRLGEYRQAIEVLQAVLQEKLPAATSKPVRSYYYLGRSFEALNQPDHAQAAFQHMQPYQSDLEVFKELLAQHPTFPETAADRADVEDLGRRLQLLS